jgi:hypothetical protein
MAGIHHLLLLWHHILGLCLPPLLFVSRYRFTTSQSMLLLRFNLHAFPQKKKTACAIVACSKNPRSQTVKPTTSGSSSFPLSCSWYALFLYSLSRSTTCSSAGSIPSLQSPLPLFAPRLRAHLFLVSTTPFHAHIALRSRHHYCALPALCPCRLLLAAHRHLACRRERPRRVRRWPRRLVHP